MRSPGHLTPDSLNPLSRKSRASSGLSLLVLTSRNALPKSGGPRVLEAQEVVEEAELGAREDEPHVGQVVIDVGEQPVKPKPVRLPELLGLVNSYYYGLSQVVQPGEEVREA